MSPGTSTGCPATRYLPGTSRWPGPKARVAPLRCTHTALLSTISCRAMLWLMKYTSWPFTPGNISRNASSTRALISRWLTVAKLAPRAMSSR